MRNSPKHSRQQGAALVIGLILLAVITLLAVVGMNISNSELASATSEQLRLRAFQAAETAVDYAMWRDNPTENDVYDTDALCESKKITPLTVVEGSPLNSATGLPTDRYTSRIVYVDSSNNIEGYSSQAFIASHYYIEAMGTSSRNSVIRNKQGAYIVNQNGNQTSWGKKDKKCFVPVVGSW